MISPLLTDLYQLTMAYGYWKLNLHEREAVFQLIFRKNPFKGNYALSCGLADVITFIDNYHFSPEDLAYLTTLTAANGEPLFVPEFLRYLGALKFSCDIDAMPEGTLVFPQEPLIRIKGPLLQGQLIESTLLNIINFQTLIATKASRICSAAGGDEVLEFGLRRAQGVDGALSASRAAYVGGCAATSNVLAGKLYNIPVRGTHAHSWVTAFPTEIAAFEAWMQVMPNNCILLVDTYNTLQGVKYAIEIGKKLQVLHGKLLGIRLDSGDLAALSIQARQLLDQAGFDDTVIVASNSLDEYSIKELREHGAQISVWGVGTSLVTAYDQPALDGVYKLTALRDENNQWQYKLKLSEQPAKISNPGIYQIRRYVKDRQPLFDIIYDTELGIDVNSQCHVLTEGDSINALSLDAEDADFIDLLKPIFRDGKRVYPDESIHEVRKRAIAQLQAFSQFYPATSYPVYLEKNIYELKQKLITELTQTHDLP